jgi:hypothetical protein
MSVIESLNNTSNKAADSGQQLYETTREYYKLKAFKHLATTTSMFSKMLLVGSLFFLGFAFFIVAGTIYLGELLESTILSCMTMGGLLFIVAGIIYALRKRIDTAIIRKLSPKFFN